MTCLQSNYCMVAHYMVFAHVTWSSLKNLVQERVCKKIQQKVFSVWKYVYAKIVCRLTSCVLVSWKCYLHMWTSGNIDTRCHKTSLQHLFHKPYSVIINHDVLHSDNQSAKKKKKKKTEKKFLEMTCCIHAAGYKKNWRHQHRRLHSENWGAGWGTYCLIRFPMKQLGFLLDFILPAALRPWNGLSLLEKWLIS